ncbi:MAG: HAMP domain-containing histidine kinase [Clostridiales bacterium]|nr:HAMP domain-containing histidine kinase [Clostridiales bacterium]
MDWIDEWAEKVRKWITRMDLKRSLVFYMLMGLLGVLAATVLTEQICSSWMELIISPYKNREILTGYTPEGRKVFFHQGVSPELLPAGTRLLLVILQEVVMQFCVIPYTMIAVILVAGIYYRNRLKAPIQLLVKEAEQIGNNRLDYSCRYESGDEMSLVCNAVDKMRQRIGENQGKIWEQMEEQRRLKAAFAHDMRTPLTVLRGYVDLLTDYPGQDGISMEKLQEILEMMDSQLYRLEEFANTMKDIHVLEDRKAEKKKLRLSKVEKSLREMTGILNQTRSIRLEITGDTDPETLLEADLSIICEVADNLISNALRYAKKEILLQLEYRRNTKTLRLYVKDDGRGFSGEELKMAMNPYYGENKGENHHFGIGLSICRTLCEKHGGNLTLANSLQGGAIVCGEFCA